MERIDANTIIEFDFAPQAVVVGGGDFPLHSRPLSLLNDAARVVCCDGAADEYIAQGLTPWRIVGDGDSLSAEAKTKYSDIIRINPDQETNDQTKAIEYLAHKGYRDIAIVAATGRREDHTLGNISLLIEYLRMGLNVRIYTDYGMMVACRDNQSFKAPIGSAVSIFGFGTKGMQSEGLAYPIRDFSSWWQGTLNKTTQEVFYITCEGDYIVYIGYDR